MTATDRYRRELWTGRKEAKGLRDYFNQVAQFDVPECGMWYGDASFSRDGLLQCKTVLIYTDNKDKQD